jgi:CheY-like chemotaxis protein
MALRAMIVDDNRRSRELIGALLRTRGIEVVARAAGGREAVALAQRLRPDAILVDVHLGSEDGVDVCAQLTALEPTPRVLLSSSDAFAITGASVDASGACGFVTKADLAAADLLTLLSPPALA